jgi:hypothetical protein
LAPAAAVCHEAAHPGICDAEPAPPHGLCAEPPGPRGLTFVVTAVGCKRQGRLTLPDLPCCGDDGQDEENAAMSASVFVTDVRPGKALFGLAVAIEREADAVFALPADGQQPEPIPGGPRCG